MKHEEMVNAFVEGAREIFIKNGEVRPVFHLIREPKPDAKGEIATVYPDFANTDTKLASLQEVRRIADMFNPDFSVFVSETWNVERSAEQGPLPDGIQPSNCIDRKEVLMVLVEEVGNYHMGTLPIIREDGVPPSLGEVTWREMPDFGGNLTKFLPANRIEDDAARREYKERTEQMMFISAIMGKALRDNEARLGPDHPAFKRFFDFSMGVMEKARKGESTAPGDRLAVLEEFNSIYREITGGDIPHYETMKADLKDKAPA